MDVDGDPKVAKASGPSAKKATPAPAATPLPKVATPIIDITDIKIDIKGGVSKHKARANFYSRLKDLLPEVEVAEDAALDDGKSSDSTGLLLRPILNANCPCF